MRRHTVYEVEEFLQSVIIESPSQISALFIGQQSLKSNNMIDVDNDDLVQIVQKESDIVTTNVTSKVLNVMSIFFAVYDDADNVYEVHAIVAADIKRYWTTEICFSIIQAQNVRYWGATVY
ncbi:hypothetical protein ROZALSC1DRAFT_24119 [Rozella allomycis CSF55]|uniref:Uncharacterized protein n=1 Tax=Rozella allomycis (strain CSF55) TaxID=988480 RepID=A0A4P9YDK9_ROZAC|nr:hypothetical protein ROZALSC1DRAFT_24119 [Rozella allomycis CSF55]